MDDIMPPQPDNPDESTAPEQVPEDLEILNSLGLSSTEAKVFLILNKLGTTEAGTISKSSGVAREFVYQILPKLRKKGLVEEIITKPKKFKPVSMKDAYTILLRRKEEENRRLHSKAMRALKKHRKTNVKHEPDSHTSLVPSREAPDLRIGQEYRNAQKIIDLTFPLGKFLQWSRHYAKIGINEAIKRNLKMRIITQEEVLSILETDPKIFTPSLKSKLKYADFRYVPKPFSVEMMIFDMKTLFVSTTKEANINKMTWLRTNNPLILEMANGYFEAMWEKAAKS
jgi:sugar-specific transcriptional regulator TrmB